MIGALISTHHSFRVFPAGPKITIKDDAIILPKRLLWQRITQHAQVPKGDELTRSFYYNVGK
jgi:hypothetical protein